MTAIDIVKNPRRLGVTLSTILGALVKIHNIFFLHFYYIFKNIFKNFRNALVPLMRGNALSNL